ncbi:MAG TPA: hypothetical protein VGO93_04480 [Candidatus Xenobia bacterium]
MTLLTTAALGWKCSQHATAVPLAHAGGFALFTYGVGGTTLFCFLAGQELFDSSTGWVNALGDASDALTVMTLVGLPLIFALCIMSGLARR